MMDEDGGGGDCDLPSNSEYRVVPKLTMELLFLLADVVVVAPVVVEKAVIGMPSLVGALML